MKSKRRNTNLKILQSQLQNLAVGEEVNEKKPLEVATSIKLTHMSGASISNTELPIIEKLPKKRGIKKDELINTRRLLTM